MQLPIPCNDLSSNITQIVVTVCSTVAACFTAYLTYRRVVKDQKDNRRWRWLGRTVDGASHNPNDVEGPRTEERER